jgi:hypothetical protein
MAIDDAEGSEGQEPITLKLKSQGREELLFKVRKTTKMQKIMDSYASKAGVAITSLRFFFDGAKLIGDITPKMLVSTCIDRTHDISYDDVSCLYCLGNERWRSN